MARTGRIPGLGAALFLLVSCGQAERAEQADPQQLVSAARLLDANADTSNWLTHGRTYDEQRFSPLDTINSDNVAELGLAWYFDIPTKRGIEATPLVVTA